MTLDPRIARSTYAACFAPWLVVGLIGPWQFLVGIAIAGALILAVAGWLKGKTT